MTDVSTTRRKAMSQSRRLRIFERDEGRCWHCGVKIDGLREPWTIEHIRALGLGGEDADANCAPAHEACRRVKDKDDVTRIAKAKRVKAAHLGIRKYVKQPIRSAGFLQKPKRSDQLPLPAPRNIFTRRLTQ